MPSDIPPYSNEFERFGRGRTPDEYKAQELKNVDNLIHESDEELERKRGVYLSLMLQAENRDDRLGLAEFNRQRLKRLSAIVQGRQRRRNGRANMALAISGLALVTSVVSVLIQFVG